MRHSWGGLADILPEHYKTVHIAYGEAPDERHITIGEADA